MTHGRFRIHSLLIASMLAGLLIAGCSTLTSESEQCHRQNRIRLEHVALNVQDPVGMAQWYCENLGMKVMRQGAPPANMRFVADARENMMLELYNNPADAVPDYRSMDPLLLHVAFLVDDVQATKEKLLAVGATVADDIKTTPAGDQIMILRDPWGLAIQFVDRADPMLRHR